MSEVVINVTKVEEVVTINATPNVTQILVNTNSGGGIPEAPIDGNLYGRKNATWEQVTSGGGIPDAPNDANAYVRSALGWVVGYTKSAIDTLLGNKVDKVSGKGLSQEDYTTAEKSKLSGIEVGATANDTDVNLKNRANHTGTQLTSTISDFVSQVGTLITNALASFKTANFIDFTSSGQTQLDGKQNTLGFTSYASGTTTVGWSSFTQKVLWYIDFNTHCLFFYHLEGPGNGINSSFTIPYTATENSTSQHIVMSNGSYFNNPGRGSIANGSNVVNLLATIPGSTWSAGISNKIASGFILIKK